MELKEQLEALKSSLEAKTIEEVKGAITEIEAKFNDAVANETKAVKEELTAQFNELKGHYNELNVKMQNREKEVKAGGDAIKGMITENFDAISNVKKGNAVEVKAVGDMTLGANLTGDQPRDYNFDVVMVPNQKVNVSDLVGSVNISGGTYTFVRETGSEGSISQPGSEGGDKSQIDYDISMIDVNTDFLAGFARYSKKMRNNLPFLESFLPSALRRDYFKAENSKFNGVLESEATASTLLAADFDTPAEMLVKEIAKLQGANYDVNGIVIHPEAWYDIQVSQKSTGAGYGLPGIVSVDGGVMRINGVPVYQATWVSSAQKYFVGDWSRIKKVVTEGLGLEFSEQDGSNFTKNLITARIEEQNALAVEQPAAIVFGDFASV
jgi:HK97 family phage major capsid protein